MDAKQRREMRKKIMDSKKRGLSTHVNVVDKIEDRKIKNRESAMLSRENKKQEMLALQRENCKYLCKWK